MKLLKKLLIIVFFTSVTLVGIESLLQAYSFTYKWVTSTPPNKNKTTILCIGESTTAVGLQTSYPSLLQIKLDTLHKNKFRVVNAGITGGNLQNIYEQLEENLQKHQPDYVVAMMGINDLLKVDQSGLVKSRFKLLQIYRWIKYLILPQNSNFELSPEQKSFILYLRTYDIDDYENPAFSAIEVADYKRAADLYTKLALEHPQDKSVLWYNAALQLQTGNTPTAIELFDRFIMLDNDPNSIILTAWFIFSKYDKNETLYQYAVSKLMTLTPSKNIKVNFLLARLNRELNKLDESLNYYLKANSIIDCNETIIYGLKYIYNIQNKIEELEKWNKQCPQFVRRSQFSELVAQFELSHQQIETYKKIIALVRKSKAKLVLMQYPLTPLEPLQRIMGPETNETIYVSNYENFKEAFKKSKYNELFTDHFASTFGHATKEGNQLIVDNLYNALNAKYIAFSQ